MDTSILLFLLGGALVAGLVVRGVLADRRRRRATEQALEGLGFRPCPEETQRLEETITRLENNRGYRYEVRDPRRLAGASPVYYYVKVRQGGVRDEAEAEEEVLFRLRRPSAAGLVLAVKPSSLGSGPAPLLRMLATGAWDAQPDDLRKLDLPPDLRDTNLVGALAPAGASLYDLVDAATLSVVQGLGDAGAMLVRFREGWCSVAGASARIQFRVEEILARVRPLL